MDDTTHQPSTGDDSSDPQSDLARLGASLREARQSRGLERNALAAKLCMGEEQLIALEEADSSRLPEPVFVIAQARRVADALGIDISLLIAPLKQSQLREGQRLADPPRSSDPKPSQRLTPAPPPALRRPPQRRGTPQRRHGGRTAGITVALLAGVVAAGVWSWRQRPPSARPSPAVRVTAPARPTGQTGQRGQLVLRAAQPSWLEVRSDSGTVLFKGTFQGERRFPSRQGLQVLAGRPDLVKGSVDGQPARPLGGIDQIRWMRFGGPGITPAKGQAPAP